MKAKALTKDNLYEYLKTFMEENDLTVEKIATVVDCPKSSVQRILERQTKPSDEMLKQCGNIDGNRIRKVEKT